MPLAAAADGGVAEGTAVVVVIVAAQTAEVAASANVDGTAAFDGDEVGGCYL